MRKPLSLKNSRKLKKSKEKMNGLHKAWIDSLLEIWRARIRITHGDGSEKEI